MTKNQNKRTIKVPPAAEKSNVTFDELIEQMRQICDRLEAQLRDPYMLEMYDLIRRCQEAYEKQLREPRPATGTNG